MFLLGKRFFGTHSRLLNAVQSPWADSIQGILKHRAIPQALKEKQDLLDAEPYRFSEIVKNQLAQDPDSSLEDRKRLHNLIIEKLTSFDFAVATVHAKELTDLSGQLSTLSVIQILQNNPGRVKSSWEFFIENFETVKASDDALNALLSKLVFFDPIEVRDGKKQMTVRDIAQAIHTIFLMQDRSTITSETWSRLIDSIISTNTSALLLNIKESVPTNYDYFTNMDELSHLQIYSMVSASDLNSLLQDNPEGFVRLFSLVGAHKTIPTSDAESQAFEAFLKEFNNISDTLRVQYQSMSFNQIKTDNLFEDMVQFIKEKGLDKNMLSYARMMIRFLGLYRGDTKRALEFYHEYLMAHPSHSNELMYELFLSFAYQGFLSSNATLLEVAETFVPPTPTPDIEFNVLRGLILVNSKFNPERSLHLFNTNIQEASREQNELTGTSDAALLCEDLILAYLRNGDRDFAHIVFEGATREKIVEGPTAVKRIKNILTIFGESIEEQKCTEVMDQEIERVLKSL